MKSSRIMRSLETQLRRLADLITMWRSFHEVHLDMLTDPDELRELKNFWPVVTLEDGRVIRHHDIVDRGFSA